MQVISGEPVAYDVNADNYFRPWKLFKNRVEDYKRRVGSDSEWINKARENEDFLAKYLSLLGVTDKVLKDPVKSLWTCTYVTCLTAVEAFWSQNIQDKRDFIVNLLSHEDSERFERLALWVWRKRFFESGMAILLGGRLSHEILQVNYRTLCALISIL